MTLGLGWVVSLSPSFFFSDFKKINLNFVGNVLGFWCNFSTGKSRIGQINALCHVGEGLLIY